VRKKACDFKRRLEGTDFLYHFKTKGKGSMGNLDFGRTLQIYRASRKVKKKGDALNGESALSLSAGQYQGKEDVHKR